MFHFDILDTAGNAAIPGVHYDALETNGYIRANTEYTDIPVHLYRDESLQDTSYVIDLALRETDEFSLPMNIWKSNDGYTTGEPNILRHLIIIDDALYKPQNWNDTYFGTYSQKKFQLMLDVGGYSFEQFEDSNVMNSVACMALAQSMKNYLDDMEAQGVIGPFEGSKPRQVLMTRQQWMEMRMNQGDAHKE